jgi:Na+/H+ antiporter NhaC
MTSKHLAAGLLVAAVIAAIYGPGPRQTLSETQARQKALVTLVGSARAGAKPDSVKPGLSIFRLSLAELCSPIGGSFGDPESELMVRTWNEALAQFKKTEITGCNYDSKAAAFELFDEEGRFGFYFGEKGLGPRWTVATPKAQVTPDLRSLLPAVLAVTVAVGFRLVVPGLMAGIVAGAMVGADGAIGGSISGLWAALADAFSSKWNWWILLFTYALIALVSIAEVSGGIAGIINKLTARVKSRRGAETATVALGGMLFFDDYANTMVVGSTMKPLTDRYGTSRAKLAYLVDSTAAPLAGIALLSTWIGYEVGLLQDISKELGLGIDGYALFLSAVPFRAYCLIALLLVFASAYSGRDLGPMIEAQRHPKRPDEAPSPIATKDAPNPAAWRAIGPLGLTFALVFAGLLFKGAAGLKGSFDPWSLSGWRAIMGVEEAQLMGVTLDIASILALASVIGLICAYAAGLQAKVRANHLNQAMVRGLKGVSPAIAILLCAWVLSSVNGSIGTKDVLAGFIASDTAATWLPAATFLLAAGTSFATGTSFGTMGILLPTLVPIAHTVGGLDATVLAIAAVMDGAIFGDHCSPLSDTTVMSSISSGCSLDEHVRTQLPYAFLAMGAALLLCYIPAGLGWFGPALALPLGGIAVLLILRVFGRQTDDQALAAKSSP